MMWIVVFCFVCVCVCVCVWVVILDAMCGVNVERLPIGPRTDRAPSSLHHVSKGSSPVLVGESAKREKIKGRLVKRFRGR